MIKVIAYTTEVVGGEILIRDSEGESVKSANPETLLNFLNEPYSDEETFAIKVFWDLDTGLAPVLRKLGISACRELASSEHTYNGVFYVPSKVFALKADKRQSYFYHLSQYYIDQPEPSDPETVAGMAENVLDAFRNMGLNPKKLTSPVAIYEAEVLGHMRIPTIMNIPGAHEEIIEYAEDCCGRLWIQAYQIGHWLAGEAFEYDLKAAHPFVASQLYNLQYAKYAKSKTIDPDAHWGFMRGIVTIENGVPISPIFYDAETDLIQPTGTFPASITLSDYKCIKRWKLGDFKMDSGYFIKFTAPVKPMEITMRRLFKQRGMGGLVNDIAKRVSTGIAGKFYEKREDGTVGKFYNPPYKAMIESITNCMVTDFIYKRKLYDNVIHIGVDSVISDRYVDLPRQYNLPMGSWRFTGIDPVLILSSGRVYHGSKKPQGLNYDQIVELIEKNPKESYYTAGLKRRQTLEESIQLNDLNGLGKMKDTTSSFDLNLLQASQGREYPKFPKMGKELLEGQFKSKPIKIVA